MPTYEYECGKCNHKFEAYQSIVADPLKKCPACGKSALNRLLGTGGGIIFKGSGFYQTDYRSDSYKQAAEAEKKAATSSSTATTATTSTTNTKSTGAAPADTTPKQADANATPAAKPKKAGMEKSKKRAG